LYNKDHGSFASTVLSDLRNSDLVVGDNRPYQFDDTDFTVPKHAIADGRSYVEFEVRQDMLEALDAIAAMTQQLSRVLVQTAAKS
jgi:predicted N-formylglutamate amidohydrolase